jgi:hypothetical protein
MRRVTPRKKLAAFRLDPELISGPEEKKERTGAPIEEQIRRAIVRWLEQNGVTAKAGGKRVGDGGWRAVADGGRPQRTDVGGSRARMARAIHATGWTRDARELSERNRILRET